jgi:hypothetical protein
MKKLLIPFLMLLVLTPSWSQDPGQIEMTVRRIADSILAGTAYRFVDVKTGGTWLTPQQYSGNAADLRIESPYNDWKYWNGVLNIYNDLAGYYNHPDPLNDIHGLGAILMAGIEVKRLIENQNRE